jgi:hypothetical protein
MLIFILVILVVIAGLVVGMIWQHSRLAKIRGELFGAGQETRKALEGKQRATKAAGDAQARNEVLQGKLDRSIAATRHALKIAEAIDGVGEDVKVIHGAVRGLRSFIEELAAGPAQGGQHRIPAAQEPYALTEADEELYDEEAYGDELAAMGEAPHFHVAHEVVPVQGPAESAVSGDGTVSYSYVRQ